MYTKTGDTWTTEFSVKGRVGSGGIGQASSTKPVTPRGMFTLHTPFGIKPNPGCPLGYTQVNASHYWSDATNRLVTYRTSGEHLIDCGAAYNYCVAIGYNLEGVPSKGSAFFLHCPISSGGATAGCISIPEANMITVLKKLRPDARIIIDTSGNISKY